MGAVGRETQVVDHVLRDRCARCVQGDVIALREDAVQIADHFHAVREILRRLVGIVAHDVHLEGQRTLRNAGTDVAAADDSSSEFFVHVYSLT